MTCKTKKKDKKNAYISIRVEADIKKMIKKKAEKCDTNISNYALECILSGMVQEKNRERISELAVICQEICNHVEKKYNGDDILEELTRIIWKNIL